jgi:hypothetical protein
MARRTVQECDLTKQEFDPEQVVTVTLKSPGKKGRSYELSPTAAEMLEKALVSREAHEVTLVGIAKSTIVERPSFGNNQVVRRAATMADFDVDDELIARKDRERLEEESKTPGPSSEHKITAAAQESGCSHPSRTPPRIETVDGNRGFWQRCKDCGSQLKYRRKVDKVGPTKTDD